MTKIVDGKVLLLMILIGLLYWQRMIRMKLNKKLPAIFISHFYLSQLKRMRKAPKSDQKIKYKKQEHFNLPQQREWQKFMKP